MATLVSYLVRALDPVAFARDGLRFHPDDWQEGVLLKDAEVC